MYERRGHPLLSRLEFLKRVGRHGLLAAAAVAGALGIGVAGIISSRALTGSIPF